MIWALALAVAGLVLVVALPGPPEPTWSWTGQGRGEAAGWWERQRRSDDDLLLAAGIALKPELFQSLRLAAVVCGALAAGWVLGPVSAVCGAAAVWMGTREWLRSRREARLLRFADHFREVLQSIANSLRAGRSMQQALEQALIDLVRVPGRSRDLLATQLSTGLEQLRLGTPIDAALAGIAERVPLEEVRLFTDAVAICRIRGGNLVQVLQTLVRLNIDRFQVRQEVRVQTAQKRMEGGVISLMPIIMLAVLTLVAPSYMAPLTHTFIGQALVGLGLTFVMVAFLITRSITRIEV